MNNCVYFDDAKRSGIIIVPREELSATDLLGVEKPVVCALAVKDPSINKGRATVFLLAPEEAEALGVALLAAAAVAKPAGSK